MAERLGGVAAGEELAVPIKVDAPGVAASLGEQLERAGPRMIAPDPLLKLDAANVGRHGAALRPVEPAVRSPGQRVGEGVGVLHAEALEQHLGVAGRLVGAGFEEVKEEVRRLNHEDSAVTEGHARGQIQPGDNVLCFAVTTVRVGVFQNDDLVAALGSLRRRLRNPVVLGAQILIHLHRLEPFGDWELQILQHPEPAAVVEGDAHRLPHHRLVGQKLNIQTFRHLKCLLRFPRRHLGRHVRRERSRIGREGERQEATQGQKDEGGDGSKRRHVRSSLIRDRRTINQSP